METEFLEHYLEASRQRLEALLQKAEELPKPLGHLWQQLQESVISEEELLRESLQELSYALEELQVASEELRQQNEQLLSNKLAIEANEYHYKAFFDLATDGYLMTTLEGSVLEGNPAVASLLQIANQLLVGKPVITFVSQDQRRHFRTQLNLLQKGQAIKNWEVLFQPRKGEPILVSLTVTPLYPTTDGIAVLCWQIHPISHRVSDVGQEEQLAGTGLGSEIKSEQTGQDASPPLLHRPSRTPTDMISERCDRLLGLAFKKSTVGMALLDRAGCAIESNPSLQTMLNYNREDLQKTSLLKLTHPYDRKINRILFEELITGKREHYCIEKRFLNKDGKTQRGSLVVSLVRDTNREPLFAMAFLQELPEVSDRQRGFQMTTEPIEDGLFHAYLSPIDSPVSF